MEHYTTSSIKSASHACSKSCVCLVDQFSILTWIPRINSVREYGSPARLVNRNRMRLAKYTAKYAPACEGRSQWQKGGSPKRVKRGLRGDEEGQDATHIY